MTVGRAGDPVDRARTVGEVGERRLITELTRAALADDSVGPLAGHDIVIGSGDDAAVIDTAGPTVISTDTSVQGRHFRFDWSDARTVGARAVIQSAADIAAMGGRTTGIVVSIGCPPDTTVGTVLDLNAGIVETAHRIGGRVLGGDLVAADQVVLGVTAVGALDGAVPIVVGGARPGDVLAVTGHALGASAAGLALLVDADTRGDTGHLDEFPTLLAAYRLPSPDLTQGPVAARAGAHAMTDISDGLIEELITMATAAGLALDVQTDRIPTDAAVHDAAATLGMDPQEWKLTGGEDHELLAAFPPGVLPPGWTRIGDVGLGSAVRVDGRVVRGLHGWQSFGD
ncbi:thiamine-phosphate kinase [Gordonia hankookensis]|uniref:Thiamine-monophosphate kinase n=1 Tax=Gordonia hankookensis TaxID=589403 RepID=A0ABR7W634_9ACTN|nr:thiamine-phosphate kinase [Gordonia hankookensis]MBD1318289.1 thiamine-phosphate kinase [Gordonia hankookensis]NDZ93825.1 thiamine-phosphate kinase [Streptomyces sp. SID11726]NEB25525.1 thiamine-phosphate kinase [Streptomyces sp. SID6673]